MKKVILILMVLFALVSATGVSAAVVDVIKEPCFEDVAVSEADYVMVKDNGLWGYADKTGEIIIECVYDEVNTFSDSLAVIKKDGKYGYINEKGEIIIPAVYDGATDFSEGLAAVKKDGKWGYIDKSNAVVISYEYDTAERFSEGVAITSAILSQGMESYIINKTGQVIFTTDAMLTGPFYNGVAMKLSTYNGGVMGLISNTGKEILSPKYRVIYSFSDGLAAVYSTDGKYGCIDASGNEVIECVYDNAMCFSDELAAVKKDGKWGYIDKTGQEEISFDYDAALDFSDGLAAVKKDGKWGCIDKEGKEIIAFDYENILGFSEGFAAVQKDGKWGYIDNEGNEVVSFVYDECKSVNGGAAFVNDGLLWGIIQLTAESEYPYVISGISLLSETGAALDAVPNSSGFVVDITINEVQERDAKDYIFVAVYGADGKLLNLDYVKADFAVNSECSFGFNVPARENAVGSVKAYIWSAFNSMVPLAENKTLSVMQECSE